MTQALDQRVDPFLQQAQPWPSDLILDLAFEVQNQESQSSTLFFTIEKYWVPAELTMKPRVSWHADR